MGLAIFLGVCFLFCSGFLAGALWRDGRAVRSDRELKSRIEALKLTLQSYRQQIDRLIRMIVRRS